MIDTIFKKLKYAQSLSNQVVICLAGCLFIASIALIWATANVLFNAGHPFLALIATLSMGKGFAHYWMVVIRFCRPDWFKRI